MIMKRHLHYPVTSSFNVLVSNYSSPMKHPSGAILTEFIDHELVVESGDGLSIPLGKEEL